MNNILRNIGCILIILSWFFIILESVGLITFKNIYSRMLTSSLADTVSTLLIIIGLLFFHESRLASSKLMILLVFLFIVNPITTHLIARSARRNGIGLTDKKGK